MNVCLLVLVCGVGISICRAGGKAEANQWDNDIRQFEQWDSKNSYPRDAVLFVGSSSIRMWRTAESFPGLALINRGFGGSQISDVNYFVNRIVLKYEPKVIVFYAGDNDVAAGKGAERVFEDYRKFVTTVRDKLSGTPVIYIGIKPSGSRWGLWPVMKKANEMIEDLCVKNKRLLYFDSATPLLDSEGKPDAELFLNDRLHLSSKGYQKWTQALRPIIEKALKMSDKTG
ncbi:MAG: hypothetical protein JW720_07895 [Sedimentisphaerales bacterium]|nr:hypothetical protein [Sedimentisphaerales bacterium]